MLFLKRSFAGSKTTMFHNKNSLFRISLLFGIRLLFFCPAMSFLFTVPLVFINFIFSDLKTEKFSPSKLRGWTPVEPKRNKGENK